jgi:hypothetical protein
VSGKQRSLFETEPAPAARPAPAPRPDRPAPEPAAPPGRLCLWPGCIVRVEERLWGCKDHWFRLPAHLRDRIVVAYTPGQERNRLLFSKAYVAAAAAAQEWIRRHGGK